MTSTLSPYDTGDIRLGDGTRDLTYLTQRPIRRPDATGEQPLYQPATIGIVPGAAGLADVDTQTLPVVPDDLLPPGLPRPPSPLPSPPPKPARHALTERVGEYPVVRPDGYRGTRRAADPPWAWALVGAGTLLAAQAVAFFGALAVAW